jgi:2-polyprenyl-3-methyl-5-hydroxy-6-metoxy-1,4-benzoquinol methylase
MGSTATEAAHGPAGATGGAPACPHCSSAAAELLRARDLNRRASMREFTYFRCPACRLVFLWPHPDDLAAHYAADYYDVQLGRAELAAAVPAERRKVDIVRAWAQPGRLLEVGPGPGGFLAAALEAGFDVGAIEMDAGCCAFLRDELGVPATHTADVAGALSEAGEQDVIALWHVLEHLAEPWRALEAAAGALRPGGVVVLATPNPEALQFRALRARWVHLDAPRHLQLVPAAVLRARAAAAGLAPVHVSTDENLELGWNAWGWSASAAALTDRPRVSAVLERAAAAAAAPLSLAERRPLRGSTLLAVLRRD